RQGVKSESRNKLKDLFRRKTRELMEVEKYKLTPPQATPAGLFKAGRRSMVDIPAPKIAASYKFKTVRQGQYIERTGQTQGSTSSAYGRGSIALYKVVGFYPRRSFHEIS